MGAMTTTLWGRALAVLASAALAFPIASAASDISQQQKTWETQFGQQKYAQMLQRGEIVPAQSPLYATLRPIADKIAAVADPQYFTPFHFVLVNERSPNAFAAPGGNVYVTTSMLMFVRTRDQLAGVLCHEVNHDIHHDVYNLYQEGQHLQAMSVPGMPPGGAQGASLSRTTETDADRAGAYTCAKAGFNPWGMVWNFRQYHDSAGMGHSSGTLSDHPSDDQRVADLVALLNGDKSAFGKFRDDVAAAAPLKLPVDRQLAQQGSGYGYPPGYSPAGNGYSPQGTPGYSPQGMPPGYPPQGQYGPPGYPPPGYGYPTPGSPPQGQGYGYPPSYPPPGYGSQPAYPPPGYGYPPQGSPPPGYGYPPQGQGYPPGYPPPGYGYPPQGQGYGYPPGYAPPGYPPQGPPPGYPPQGPPPGYPPPGYPPQGPTPSPPPG